MILKSKKEICKQISFLVKFLTKSKLKFYNKILGKYDRLRRRKRVGLYNSVSY